MSRQVGSTLRVVAINVFCFFVVAQSATATTTEMGKPLFTEITSAVGLEDTSERWPSDGTYTLPEIMGGGVALLDYDNDGDLDLLQIRSLLFEDQPAIRGDLKRKSLTGSKKSFSGHTSDSFNSSQTVRSPMSRMPAV